MTTRRLWLVLALILGSMTALAAGLVLPDKPGSRVNDYAGVLSANARHGIEQRLAAIEQSSGHQLAIAIFKSLEGEALEDVANRLFEKWGLGSREKNDGLLVLMSVEDRKLKIEVGYGLEGDIPDVVASEIIRRDMVPYLREGAYDAAILSFANRVSSIFSGEPMQVRRKKPVSPMRVLAFVAVFFFVIALLRSAARAQGNERTLGPFGVRRRRSGLFIGGFGGGFGGFGGGGGGWGGGGFGGGGGLSGGGGASGSW